MTNRTDSRPVVYAFVDPAFRWDVSALGAEAERRGFRVVRGENADELLFLLQMGRPAAILFTLATPEARTYASFHMISQRALDMLVPMVIAGPEDPRDGLLLRYPVGRAIEERYVPVHAIGDLFEEFYAVPPTTPSRPAPFVEGQTFGKGRTIMSWRRSIPPGPTRVSSVPPGPRPISATPSQPPTPLDTEPSEPDEPTELYEGPPPGAAAEPGSLRRTEPAVRPVKPAPWKIIATVVGGVAIGAAALTLYVLTAPEPVPRPRGITRPSAARPEIARPQIARNEVAPPPGAPPAIAPKAAHPEERPAKGDASAGRSPPPKEPPTARTAAGEQLLQDASGAIRFPGHFKDETAMFFFVDDGEEARFLDLVRSLGPDTVIRLTGHATFDELKTGPDKLARGRAWAVEKYLVRRGIPKERLRAEGGLPVRSGSDPDARGKSLSRWVDVRFEGKR